MHAACFTCALCARRAQAAVKSRAEIKGMVKHVDKHVQQTWVVSGVAGSQSCVSGTTGSQNNIA